MAHSPPPKLWYLPNHRDALQAQMHLLHKLGNAKTEANYHAYYQTLIKDGTANGATSNAYLSSNVPLKTKCIIMKYRTGTLYNQKHAVLFKLSTSQTCPLPLPTSRQCPAHSFWVPTHANKEHDHRKAQLSMPHDLEGHQQNRLLRIMRCLHRHRQQQTDDHAKSPDY